MFFFSWLQKTSIFARAASLVLLATSGSVAYANQYTAVDLYALRPPKGLSIAPPKSAFGGQVVGLGGTGPLEGDPTYSLLWKQDGSVVNFGFEGVVGTDGVQQWGYGPTVWNGSAASATMLLNHPDYTYSGTVWGSGGGQYVGSAFDARSFPIISHALLWNGLAATPVDLNPTLLVGFTQSFAYGTSGAQQVGVGSFHPAAAHALLWTGSADSAVDLSATHIPEITLSYAVATDGRQQVGDGRGYDSPPHALLWSGTADSEVDLNPVGFWYSYAKAVSNGRQVGYGDVSGGPGNALLWSGARDSVVNLHQLLPGAFISSKAWGIDEAGNVFGTAFNSSDQLYHAIEWVPHAVPEPGSAGLLLMGFFGLCALRLHRRTSTARDASCSTIRPAAEHAPCRGRKGVRTI